MAVVSTNKLKLPDGTEYVRKAKCDSYGTFECLLPPLIAKHSDESTVTGKTLEDCLSNWTTAVNRFFDGKREESHVILFKYSRSPDKYSFSKCPDLFFEFYACACIEIKTTDASGAVSYQYERPEWDLHTDEAERWELRIPESIRDDELRPHRRVDERPEQIIPYNDAAIRFFIEMDNLMTKLKDRLDEVLASPATLLSFAAGGLALLSDHRSKGSE